MARPRDDDMSANEFGQLRSYLARNSVSQTEIDEAIGTSAAGRSREEVAGEITAWLKTRAKQ